MPDSDVGQRERKERLEWILQPLDVECPESALQPGAQVAGCLGSLELYNNVLTAGWGCAMIMVLALLRLS
jgi:hypothetical protein